MNDAGKDYDEFRNFVSVSQLKPASGRDISSLFSGASGTVARGSVRNKPEGGQVDTLGGFDDMIQRRKDASESTISIAKLDGNLQSLSLGKEVPTGNVSKGTHRKAGKDATKSSRAAYDFLREWKQRCTNAEDTLAFLTKIKDTDGSFESKLLLQPDLVCKEYFSTDIDSDIVGDIVEALHLLVCTEKTDDPPPAMPSNNASTLNGRNDTANCSVVSPKIPESSILSFAHRWLKALTNCGRFELSVSFLMPDQQLKLKDICNSLKNEGDEANSDDYLLRYDTLLK